MAKEDPSKQASEGTSKDEISKKEISKDESTVNVPVNSKNSKIKKKVKNLVITLLEIAVVSLIIIGILMGIQSSLKGNSPISFIVGKDKKTQEIPEQVASKEKKGTGNYYIEVNIKKNALIVYEYDKDKEKVPLKVYPASVGKSVETGKYKIKEKYGWMSSGTNNWNKYSSYFTNKTCIQSVNFREKYSWTMYESSYKALGKERVEGANIKLSVNAAKWIYNNCGVGTEIKIIKGKKADELPVKMEKLKEMYSGCGWDPTDSDKRNPYKNKKDGEISAYTGTVYIEKGNEPKYLFNVLAFDKDGKNITKKLKYEEFDYNTLGEYEVKYSYNKDNLKLKSTIKYKVIDTTVPIVSAPERLSLEIDNFSQDVLKSQDTKTKMENLVKAHSSSNEGTIEVYAVPYEMFEIENNYVRVVATDESGNIGSAQTIVNLTAKSKKINERYDPKKNQGSGGMSDEEETTKKKKPKKEEKTTKQSDVEETTKKQESPTSDSEEEATSAENSNENESDDD